MNHIIKITVCFQIKNNSHKKILMDFNNKSQFCNNYNKIIIIIFLNRNTMKKGNLNRLSIKAMQIIIFNNSNNKNKKFQNKHKIKALKKIKQSKKLKTNHHKN